MTTPRCCATTASHQGKIIIVGGHADNHKLLASTELLDSTTGQWYATDDLPTPHSMLKSVIMDGVLFLLGGDNQGGMSPAVFSAPLDILSGHKVKWKCCQDTPWCYSSPINVKCKHLLVAGVWNETKNVRSNNIFMLNKISQTWEIIGKIPSSTCTSATVSLPDNTIIIVGGYKDKRQYSNRLWIGLCESQ